MAITETPPETAAAAEPASVAPRAEPTGLAAVLGSGDHKVIGRLYVASALVFALGAAGLGIAFGLEATSADTMDVFTTSTVLSFFTLFRVGSVFLVALPLVIGIAMVVVPLQVGARTIAFPRAAAVSYWAWLMGAALLVAAHAIDGGPGGGRTEGVHLWIAAMGVLVLAVLVASVCLATTVLALRTPGLGLARLPLFSWSVAVAAIMWLLTLPVLLGLLALMYVDSRHGAGTGLGDSAQFYGRLTWFLRNPQIYVIAIPVLGLVGDVLATTARARIAARPVAQGAIAAFGVLGFGAFLAGADADTFEIPLLVVMALAAVLPGLVLLGLAGELFRRGTFRLTAGAAYATAALVVLLHATVGGALGSIPPLETNGTIFDVGVGTATVLATIIAGLGGAHWWAVKLGRRPATEALGLLAPLVLLLGSALVVIPHYVSGIAGSDAELRPDWTGGIEALNWVLTVGWVVVLLGLVAAIVSLLPLVRTPDADTVVATDPWEGQSLEWLTPSPPPLANFGADVPMVTSAEPLVDLREEK